MKRRVWAVLAVGLAVIATVAFTSAALGSPARQSTPTARELPAPPKCGTLSTPPTYKHILLIMFENHSYSTIYKSASAAYINSVISACGLATNYHNISHPSLPNYIGMSGGNSVASLKPFLPDCSPGPTCQTTENNIFHEAITWKA
jgi:hypothetical protein